MTVSIIEFLSFVTTTTTTRTTFKLIDRDARGEKISGFTVCRVICYSVPYGPIYTSLQKKPCDVSHLTKNLKHVQILCSIYVIRSFLMLLNDSLISTLNNIFNKKYSCFCSFENLKIVL